MSKNNTKATKVPAPKPAPTKKPTLPKKSKAAPATKNEAVLATVLSPKGKEYAVTNISAFARRFNLDRSGMSRVISGQRTNHKNWTLKTN
jgi:hypothetical protein